MKQVSLAKVQESTPVSVMPEKVAAFVQDSRSANTRRAYLSDWAGFEAWCNSRGVPAFPASPMTVAEYISDLAGSAKASTIGRKVASISTAHKMKGLESPCTSELVLSTLKGIRRSLTVATRKVAPVRVTNLRAGFDSMGTDPASIRNKALILIGYAGGFRRSELVALDLSDVEVTPDGLIVTVRRSKTDQTGQGHRKGIPGGANPATCPVRAFMAWVSILGQTDGPVFRRILKGGKVTSDRLTPQVVGLVVKDLAPAMGLDPSKVGGHSMRAGFVTDAYAVGAPEASIMATTGHKSHAVMSGYRREGNLFKQNAAAMIGL